MPEFEDIHASLVVNERVLEEFDDPDYPFNPLYNPTRYIEAKQDQAFRVQITLRQGFDFCGADVVRCRLFLDDDTAPFWTTLANRSPDGIVREDVTKYISTATRQNEGAGRWEKMHFVFGGLTVVEDEEGAAAYVPEITAEQARNLGTIRLACFRAIEREEEQREPLHTLNENPTKRRPIVSQVLKKDLVNHRDGDKFLSTTIKFGPGKTTRMRGRKHNMPRYVYRRIQGRPGDNIEFVFKYRSRQLLHSLKVIRASPSPTPVDSSSSPLVFFTPEPEIVQCGPSKRKREIDQSDDNGDIVMKAIKWKRARTGELVEVIDLTED